MLFMFQPPAPMWRPLGRGPSSAAITLEAAAWPNRAAAGRPDAADVPRPCAFGGAAA